MENNLNPEHWSELKTALRQLKSHLSKWAYTSFAIGFLLAVLERTAQTREITNLYEQGWQMFITISMVLLGCKFVLGCFFKAK